MGMYAGLDVSQQETHLCILDQQGAVRWSGRAATDPDALAATLRRQAPDLTRAVLESGALSALGRLQPAVPAGTDRARCARWLCAGLLEAGLPAVCIDARAAHGALKQRRGKTDRSDAEGLARLAQIGPRPSPDGRPGGNGSAAPAADGSRSYASRAIRFGDAILH